MTLRNLEAPCLFACSPSKGRNEKWRKIQKQSICILTYFVMQNFYAFFIILLSMPKLKIQDIIFKKGIK